MEGSMTTAEPSIFFDFSRSKPVPHPSARHFQLTGYSDKMLKLRRLRLNRGR